MSKFHFEWKFLVDCQLILAYIVAYIFSAFIQVWLPYRGVFRDRKINGVVLLAICGLINLWALECADVARIIFLGIGTPFIASSILQRLENQTIKKERDDVHFALERLGNLVYDATLAVEKDGILGYVYNVAKKHCERDKKYDKIVLLFDTYRDIRSKHRDSFAPYTG